MKLIKIERKNDEGTMVTLTFKNLFGKVKVKHAVSSHTVRSNWYYVDGKYISSSTSYVINAFINTGDKEMSFESEPIEEENNSGFSSPEGFPPSTASPRYSL